MNCVMSSFRFHYSYYFFLSTLRRHTFATLSLALGIDLYTVCKLLGHKNIISTQVYAKIIDASKRQAIDRFNGVLDA